MHAYCRRFRKHNKACGNELLDYHNPTTMVDIIIDTHFGGWNQSILFGNMTFFHSAAYDEEQFLATAKHVPYSQS